MITREQWERMRTARASAKPIRQLVAGDFVTWWVPRLGGESIMHDGRYKYSTRAEAVDAARLEKHAMGPWDRTGAA
jgi:hypothetical protein